MRHGVLRADGPSFPAFTRRFLISHRNGIFYGNVLRFRRERYFRLLKGYRRSVRGVVFPWERRESRADVPVIGFHRIGRHRFLRHRLPWVRGQLGAYRERGRFVRGRAFRVRPPRRPMSPARKDRRLGKVLVMNRRRKGRRFAKNRRTGYRIVIRIDGRNGRKAVAVPAYGLAQPVPFPLRGRCAEGHGPDPRHPFERRRNRSDRAMKTFVRRIDRSENLFGNFRKP